MFKNRIVNNITESDFKSLNNGELDLIFKDIDPRISSFQNFLEYLYSDELKDYQLLWELFTKPNNWLFNLKNIIGINLFIIEIIYDVDDNTKNKINVICPN